MPSDGTLRVPGEGDILCSPGGAVPLTNFDLNIVKVLGQSEVGSQQEEELEGL